jgi:peptide/nickel transport system substrate-binding protein
VKTRKLLAAPLLAGALAMVACGGGGSGGTGGSASDQPSVAPITSQDINVQDRASLTQGGQVRLAVAEFCGGNWNVSTVDCNNDDMSHAMQPVSPRWFLIDAKGVATPDPDYVLSATETSKSPTTVEFKLNPKAVWGDGTPITAADAIATVKACDGTNKKFNCVTTQGYDQVKSIKQGADQFSFTLTFKGPYPDWTSLFSGLPSVDRAESVKDPDTFNTGWKQPYNKWLSGPYKVDNFDASQKVLTLVPNDKWWGDKPLLDKITFRAIADDAQAAAFVNGELDSFDIGPNPDAYKRALAVSDGAVRKAAGPNFRHITFNTKSPILSDLKVRQAIVEGLDREAIGSSDLAGIDWPVTPLNNHILLTNQEGYADSAKATGIDYNPDKAKADLDADGWKAGADGIREKDGKKLEVGFSQLDGVSVSENEALQTQNMLKDIGIKVNIVNVPISKFQDGSLLTKHEFDLVAFSWIGTPYPFTSIKQIYGTGQDSNFAQLSMPDVDALLKQIDVETDPAKRIDLANQADKIIWENVHTLPLYQRPDLKAVKAKLANYGAFGLSDKNFKWEDVGYQK